MYCRIKINCLMKHDKILFAAFAALLFPFLSIHAQTGSGSMMIMGDIDVSQFKNLKFNIIPTPNPRNYSTRVAIDTSRLSVTYRYTITEPD